MSLTVGEVARLSGVTVRTLHHYDGIGLLRPGARGANGYRHSQAMAGAIVYRRVMSGEPFTTAEIPALLATVLGADES